jgi:hypothetical protein
MNIIIMTGGEIGADFIEAITREPDVNIYFSPSPEDTLRIIRSAGSESLILGQAARRQENGHCAGYRRDSNTPLVSECTNTRQSITE